LATCTIWKAFIVPFKVLIDNNLFSFRTLHALIVHLLFAESHLFGDRSLRQILLNDAKCLFLLVYHHWMTNLVFARKCHMYLKVCAAGAVATQQQLATAGCKDLDLIDAGQNI